MFKQLNPILPVKEILKEINGLADEMAGLSNLELKNKTQEFKERLAQGESYCGTPNRRKRRCGRGSSW